MSITLKHTICYQKDRETQYANRLNCKGDRMLGLHGEVVGRTSSLLGLGSSTGSRYSFRPCKRLRVCSSIEAVPAGVAGDWGFSGDAAAVATDDAAVHFKQQAATTRKPRQSADALEDLLSPRSRVHWSRGQSRQPTDQCFLTCDKDTKRTALLQAGTKVVVYHAFANPRRKYFRSELRSLRRSSHLPSSFLR